MTTTTWRTAATVAGLAIAGSMLGYGLSRANADGITTVQSVSMTADKTDLTGLDQATLTVTVRMTNDGTDGLQEPAIADIQTVDALGNETSVDPQALNHRRVDLRLASGSQYDGTWVGQAMIGAINAGDWQVTKLEVGGFNGSITAQTTTQPIHVTGAHWPDLTISVPQAPVTFPTSYTVHGTARWSDTGDPIPNLPLTWGGGQRSTKPDGDENVLFGSPGQVNFLGAFAPVTTGPDGAWSATTTWPVRTSTISFGLNRLGEYYQWDSQVTGTGHTVRYAVTAAVSGRRISGTVRPKTDAYFTRVLLERRSSGVWRQVAHTTPAFATGSYSFTATSAGTYRVVAERQPLTDDGVEIEPAATSARTVS